MNLDEEKKQKVIGWIKEGRKLSEIQNLLASEFGIRLTYMEVRLLVDDLNVMPVDTESEKEKPLGSGKQKSEKSANNKVDNDAENTEVLTDVSVTVDDVTRPGAVMSGRVRFSDGVSGEWYFDEMGRLGLITSRKDYRPSEQDLRKFQIELQNQLRKLGYF
ncbi:MAG: hypothetical protein ACPMAG_06860 [Limisphaerales bacterium]|jgi:hypothetical protein